MGTAIKHPVPDQVKHGWASECPVVKYYKWRLNPVWHRMLYSCTHMATVGIKLLTLGWQHCSSIHCVQKKNTHSHFLPYLHELFEYTQELVDSNNVKIRYSLPSMT